MDPVRNISATNDMPQQGQSLWLYAFRGDGMRKILGNDLQFVNIEPGKTMPVSARPTRGFQLWLQPAPVLKGQPPQPWFKAIELTSRNFSDSTFSCLQLAEIAALSQQRMVDPAFPITKHIIGRFVTWTFQQAWDWIVFHTDGSPSINSGMFPIG
jgi:hypothetical protein